MTSKAEQAKSRIWAAINKIKKETGEDPFAALVEMACEGRDERQLKLPAWRIIVDILKIGENNITVNANRTAPGPSIYLPEEDDLLDAPRTDEKKKVH